MSWSSEESFRMIPSSPRCGVSYRSRRRSPRPRAHAHIGRTQGSRVVHLVVVGVFLVRQTGEKQVPNVIVKELDKDDCPIDSSVDGLIIYPPPPEGAVLQALKNGGHYELISNKFLKEQDGHWGYFKSDGMQFRTSLVSE